MSGLHAAFYRPGQAWNAEPYARVYAPVTAPPGDFTSILGGELTVLRGGFPDQGKLELSRPLAFRAGDWVRVWLPGDAPSDPTYTGQAQGEPWPDGAGTVELTGVWESVKRARWVGAAKGDFPTFFRQVLNLSDLPAWLPLAEPLPVISSVFSSDVPHEVLGDTINAITPALDGYLIGATAAPALACVDPGLSVTHRFHEGESDRPPGSTSNYANAARVTFDYPSGDRGYYEARLEDEITERGGMVQWYEEGVTAREMGLPTEPFEGYTGRVIQTVRPNGVPEYQQDITLTGTVLSNVNLSDAQVPDLTETTPITAYETAEEKTRADRLTRADLTFWANIWETLRQVLGAQPGYAPEDFRTHQTLQDNANLIVNARVTTLPGWDLLETLRIGTVATDGAVTWFNRPNADVSSRFNALFHPEGIWKAIPNPDDRPELRDVYELMIVTNYVNEHTQGKDQRFAIGYAPAFLTAADAANVPVQPISLRGGGGLYYVDNVTPKRAPFPGNLDRTVIGLWAMNGPAEEYHTLRFPLLTTGFTPADSGLSRGAGEDIWYGVAFIELNTPITLPYGASVEVELLPGGSVAACWALHTLDLPAAQTEAARAGTGLPSGVMVAVSKAQPTPYTVLLRNGETGDGWARFAVRYPDSWNGSGDPPGPMTVTALLLQGVSKAGRVRVRVPQLDGLNGYALRLLRYRSRPMRDWLGGYATLGRVPALGTAAFEVPGQADDELLDVQRVTYDLSPDAEFPVTVQAGSPTPVDDVDAVGGSIDSLKRVIRRAGGQK